MTKKDDIPEIAQRIRQLREERRLSQRKLAELAHVTDAAVNMWETGKRFPRGRNLKNLAVALGVAESVILEGADRPTPEMPQDKSRAQKILDLQTKLLTLSDDDFGAAEAVINNLNKANRKDEDVLDHVLAVLPQFKKIPTDVLIMLSHQEEKYFESLRRILKTIEDKKISKLTKKETI